MSFGRDLYKTKLCSLYQRGNCPRQSCSFAHGEAELRRHGGSTFNGRRDFRGGDLRERLQRRHSPHRRLSPGRDVRGHQDRGHSYSRSPVRGRSSKSASPGSVPQKRDRKRPRHDEPAGNFSDGSGDPRDANGNSETNTKLHFSDPVEMLGEELQLVDDENEALTERLHHFQSLLDQRTKDVDSFSAKNLELDSKLQKVHDDYKRCSSKLKKFVKLYLRCLRAEEERKKTQARLQKLVEDLPSCDVQRFPPHCEDSDVNIVSDGEANQVAHDYTLALGIGTTMTTCKDGSDMEGFSEKILVPEGQTRLLKSSKLELAENGTNKELPNRPEFEHAIDLTGRSFTVLEKGKVRPHQLEELSHKLRSSDVSVALPSTGLAAHAEDEIVENDDDRHPLPDAQSHQIAASATQKVLPGQVPHDRSRRLFMTHLSQDLSMASSQYAQYKGDDEDVDVEEMEDVLVD